MDGWLKTGLPFWPELYFVDISLLLLNNYFSRKVLTAIGMWVQRGKGLATDIYANGFIGEVLINLLAGDCKYCYIITNTIFRQ
jgi:hypothetical protein